MRSPPNSRLLVPPMIDEQGQTFPHQVYADIDFWVLHKAIVATDRKSTPWRDRHPRPWPHHATLLVI